MQLTKNLLENKEKYQKIILEKDIVWKSYDIFKNFFETNIYDGHVTFKTITTKMVNNIDDLKIFFEIIKQVIETENINNIDENSLLSIIFNKKILNNKPAIILNEIKKWLTNKNYNQDTYYLFDEFEEDMQSLLLLINSFLDKNIIELKIIKKENLKLVFKENIVNEIEKEFEKIEKLINENDYETAANKIEHLYTNFFLKEFFKEQKIDKKVIINLLSNKNKILEKMNTTEEFNSIFSLISKIRNAIKGKNKTSNDESTHLISKNFWNNDFINENERKSFLKLYVDFSKTLFNFLINNLNLKELYS